MKKLTWLFILLLLTSCELFEAGEEDNPDGVTGIDNLNEYTIGSRPSGARQLTEVERDRGELICTAFRSMRRRINPYINGSFTLSENDCNNTASRPVNVSSRINVTANQTPSMNAGALYFKDVYSDLHYHLKDVCDSLLRNDDSTDTFTMDSITSIKVRFRETNRRTYVQVYEFIKSQLEFIHTIEVGMDSSTEGLNITRSLSRRCNNPNRVHSFTQSLTSVN